MLTVLRQAAQPLFATYTCHYNEIRVGRTEAQDQSSKAQDRFCRLRNDIRWNDKNDDR